MDDKKLIVHSLTRHGGSSVVREGINFTVRVAAIVLFGVAGSIAHARISDTYDYWLPLGEGGSGIYFDHLQMKIDTPCGFLKPIGYENGD